ncbi:MAG: type II toxin-antitoxin system RelB/DinJ family antitoxin [Propionibacteriaceae bacterium]|nr:type II toxin-antitoxin system RelB/DinJ family antitoxin [Propionibacteriaceae bacterium]
MMVPITTKVRKTEKDEFLQVAESIGTTPSNAIRMFVAAFNKRGGFPFDPANPYGYNQETLQAMRDAAEGRNLSEPFDTVEALMADLNADA